MTWPPDNQPTGGKSDSTPMATDHPTEHNAIKDTLDDIITGVLPLTGGTVTGDLQVDGVFRAANGTVSAPSITFTSQTDTGLYTLGNKDVGVAAGGALVLRAHPSYVYSYRQNIGVDGSRSNPTYSFQSDTNTGMHRPETDVIELVVGGQRAAQFGAADQGAKAGAWLPGINYKTTVAYTPNVWVHPDAAQEGALFRSTSSRSAMSEVETVSLDATDQVGELRPLWFRSTATGDDPALSHYGLAAEDVAELDPRLATYITDDDGNTRPDDVNYRAITALLVSEVQRQRAQLAALEARLAALEA